MSDSQNSTNPLPEGSSPMPGCIIIVTILVVFGGLAILYAVVASHQNKVISGFTDPEPIERPVATPTTDEIAASNQKLEQLESATKGNRMEKISFSASDLNNLIASRELLADFRGQAHISRITKNGIEADMSQPMRKGFLGGRRYLNATFVLQPELRRRTVLLKVVDIRVPDRTVPKPFIEGYAGLEFFRLDPKHERMGPVIKKLSSVRLKDGEVIIETQLTAPE